MKTYTQPKSGSTKHVFSSIQRNIPKYYAKDNQHRTHKYHPFTNSLETSLSLDSKANLPFSPPKMSSRISHDSRAPLVAC